MAQFAASSSDTTDTVSSRNRRSIIIIIFFFNNNIHMTATAVMGGVWYEKSKSPQRLYTVIPIDYLLADVATVLVVEVW